MAKAGTELVDGGSGAPAGSDNDGFEPDLGWGHFPDGRARKQRSKAVGADLPRALENLTTKTFKFYDKLLSMDATTISDARLRAVVACGGQVLAGKIRVDEASLRVRHDNDVLDRLEKIVKEARKALPPA
jgi:hypothetical protein